MLPHAPQHWNARTISASTTTVPLPFLFSRIGQRPTACLSRARRESMQGMIRGRRASRLVASAAPIPDRPQGGTPEQLPFSGSSNSPSSNPVGQFPAEEKKPNFVTRVIKPLQDFGFGKMAFMEGGVGLFIFAGIGLTIVLTSWARGGQLGRRGKGYQCVLEFPLACGIGVGTPVRIRGVPVGSVLTVNPSLEKVEVLIDVKKSTTVIPRNSNIEANQSGLIAEPLIDITPQLPIPEYKASPLDPECEHEGKIVCSQGHIKGRPGVAMDDLVYICTKIARQMDAQGLDRIFDAAEAAAAVAEEARPLLQRVVELVDEVTPLLSELREGNMVNNLEDLTRSASEAAADIHRLQDEVLTTDNVKALRDSVLTLTKTLQHIEGITGDLGGFTGDARNKSNLKQLIEALSRIVAD
ncbi:g6821 [Coccomyxa viridis]|uniref:G6821 protein n=1 Tax=Coccomyxa viridis TaxID=1274662 RepID=A0ABP1FYS0_9CHLO